MREKCSYSDFLSSVFSNIRIEYELPQIYIIASNLVKNIYLPTGLKFICCLDPLVTICSQIQPRVWRVE